MPFLTNNVGRANGVLGRSVPASPYTGAPTGGMGGFAGGNPNMLLALGMQLLANRQNRTAAPFSSVAPAAFLGAQADAQLNEKRDLAHARNLTVDWLKKTHGLSDDDAQAAVLNPTILSSYLSPKKNFQRLSDKSIFDPVSGEVKNVDPSGEGDLFDGTSTEGQALNYLVRLNTTDPSKGLTKEQASEVAAGHQVTGADGKTYFFTPQGLVGQAAGGGAASTDVPGGVQAPPGDLAAPAGARQLTGPRPGGRVTEDQAKGQVLLQNALPDYQKLVTDRDEKGNKKTPLIDSLTSKKDQALGAVGGPAQYFQTGDFQAARDAVANIVQAYIYAVSGAQAPEAEVKRNSALVLPSYVDADERVNAKKARLENMVKAIRIKASGGVVPTELQGLLPDLGGPAPADTAPAGLSDLYSKYGLTPP